MKRFIISPLTIALPLGALLSAPAVAEAETVFTRLNGFEEVPAISTAASGDFLAAINEEEGVVTYILRYDGLESDVLMAHIHLGQAAANGGISVWLCTTEAAPAEAPAETPTCPQSGEVTGTFQAADVVGPVEQGLDPGELEPLIEAIRDGVTYANVHTETFPGGEIRGQIR